MKCARILYTSATKNWTTTKCAISFISIEKDVIFPNYFAIDFMSFFFHFFYICREIITHLKLFVASSLKTNAGHLRYFKVFLITFHSYTWMKIFPEFFFVLYKIKCRKNFYIKNFFNILKCLSITFLWHFSSTNKMLYTNLAYCLRLPFSYINNLFC